MARIITVACHKGGVGKTTTAASLGAIFAARGRKVLLVDVDAQKNLTETFLEGPFENTVAEAFARRCALPAYKVRKNLDLVPSSDDVCSIDVNYGSVAGKEFILRELLDGVQGRYDLIIIDSPAQLGTVTANALVAADRVLIPVNGDAYSIGGLRQITDLIGAVHRYYNPRLEVMGIVLTKYNGRRIVDRKVKEALDASFNDKLFNTVIRENASIVQAPLCHTDIVSYDPSSNGAKDYKSLCDEISLRIKKIR